MQLQFLRGDAQAPRGHAIVLVRPAGSALATYCIVLPIRFSMGRYLPPIIASQLPAEGLSEMANSPSVMPVPPMFEEVADVEALLDLAEKRDDDVVEVDRAISASDARRIELAAEACAEYAQLYERFTASRPRGDRVIRAESAPRADPGDLPPATPPADDLMERLLSEPEALPERSQLSEIVRLVGTLRYAVEGNDERLRDETTRALRQKTAVLPEKYRANDLINVALIAGPRGQQLTQLYIDRAYKLADEDYTAIPAIEEQIRRLG